MGCESCLISMVVALYNPSKGPQLGNTCQASVTKDISHTHGHKQKTLQVADSFQLRTDLQIDSASPLATAITPLYIFAAHCSLILTLYAIGYRLHICSDSHCSQDSSLSLSD